MLNNKLAVVTGASRGIGFAIVQALASHNCNIIITSRHATSAEQAAEKLVAPTTRRLSSGRLAHDARAIPFQCDVRDELSIQRLFAFVLDEFKQLDFLINNAGIYGPAKPVDEVDTNGWREALDTNLTGTFLCTRYALPLMKSGSVIVNNLSVAARAVFPNSAAYIASKQGALGLTNATREDVRHRGIRVLALMPGATNTEIWNQFWPEAPREKMMDPRDIASAVVSALMMPPRTSVDEIHIMPTEGKL